MGLKQLPKCKRPECKYHYNRRCTILNSSNFKGRECPFFKEKENKDNDK